MSLDKYERYRPKVNFLKKYKESQNAATSSDYDPNANVEMKNIATGSVELNKKEYIGTNRLLLIDKLNELYGEDIAEKYIEQLESHRIYKHDETSIFPYCVSVTLYPYLFNGMTTIGGKSGAPKHLESFCGSFSNLVFAIASQFAGAVATPEFLMYMDYFIRKDYGDDYYLRPNEIVKYTSNPRTIFNIITDCWQQIIYTMNEPAGARNYQAPFWNIAYFDKYYFKGMFEDFVFPDGSEPKWESVNWLQQQFMIWFNEERLKQVLTFPVETVNLLNNGEDFEDQEWYDFTAEMWSRGHSFFCYTSDSVDSLASCCLCGDEIIHVLNCSSNKEEDIKISDLCINIENGEHYKTLSFNNKLKVVEWEDIIDSLIKKNNYNKLIEIIDEDGNMIKVTPDHLIYVYDIEKNIEINIPAQEISNHSYKYLLIKNN